MTADINAQSALIVTLQRQLADAKAKLAALSEKRADIESDKSAARAAARPGDVTAKKASAERDAKADRATDRAEKAAEKAAAAALPTYRELQGMCKKAGVAANGSRVELVARLRGKGVEVAG